MRTKKAVVHLCGLAPEHLVEDCPRQKRAWDCGCYPQYGKMVAVCQEHKEELEHASL